MDGRVEVVGGGRVEAVVGWVEGVWMEEKQNE